MKRPIDIDIWLSRIEQLEKAIENHVINDDKLSQHNHRILALETNGIPGVRDFFATSALSILSNSKYDWSKANKVFTKAADEKEVAEYCYRIADAMMEERKKNNE